MKFFGTLSVLCISIFGGTAMIEPAFFYNRCEAERNEPWSYRGSNGPFLWGFIGYPMCNGLEQSPIPILSRSAVKDENLAKLMLMNYNQSISKAIIENNGHTIQVTPDDGVSRTISVNRDDTYSLQQFHFHWGDSPDKGSEHTLDGTQYAMEMHLVHMNAQDEIAVVGIFFQEQDSDNEELQKLVDEFPNVEYKNEAIIVNSNIDLNKLVKENPTSYYRYKGSLTTPDCAEGVTWSVVPDPMPVGKAQMNHFRNLFSVERGQDTSNCKLVNNYRHLKLPFGRRVHRSQ